MLKKLKIQSKTKIQILERVNRKMKAANKSLNQDYLDSVKEKEALVKTRNDINMKINQHLEASREEVIELKRKNENTVIVLDITKKALANVLSDVKALEKERTELSELNSSLKDSLRSALNEVCNLRLNTGIKNLQARNFSLEAAFASKKNEKEILRKKNCKLEEDNNLLNLKNKALIQVIEDSKITNQKEFIIALENARCKYKKEHQDWVAYLKNVLGKLT